ncbi:hypothetical protein B0H13DRAFT_2308105 [Mycena leptocephala]|nr:hypothetical protein B0H13DRAFT_2308105 [Mycena leptocephala]
MPRRNSPCLPLRPPVPAVHAITPPPNYFLERTILVACNGDMDGLSEDVLDCMAGERRAFINADKITKEAGADDPTLRLTEFFIHSGESLLPRAASRGNSRVERSASHFSLPAIHEFYPGFKCNCFLLARIREDTSTSFATVRAAVEPLGDPFYADSRLWILRLPLRRRREGLVLRHPRGPSMQHPDKRPAGAPQDAARNTTELALFSLVWVRRRCAVLVFVSCPLSRKDSRQHSA